MQHPEPTPRTVDPALSALVGVSNISADYTSSVYIDVEEVGGGLWYRVQAPSRPTGQPVTVEGDNLPALFVELARRLGASS